jgi:hypothetical protein
MLLTTSPLISWSSFAMVRPAAARCKQLETGETFEREHFEDKNI